MKLLNGDLMGKAVLAFQKTARDLPVRLWINGKEDSPLYPSIFFREWEDMPELEQLALNHTSGRVLDCGAGAGCHSLALIRHNPDTREVISLDISPSMCEVMKLRGLEKIMNLDVMDLAGEKFDTILLLMNGFGIAGSEKGLSGLINHLKSLLLPGGRIIGESTDVFYMFATETGVAEIDLRGRYYGEVEFKLRLKDQTEVFPWIYADEVLLEDLATSQGLAFEVLYRGESHNFLCSMRKSAV